MKLLLLDDHKIFGESLKLLLEEQEDIFKCEYVSNIENFLQMIKFYRYDILLVDINLKSDITGLDLIKEILSENPKFNIVVLTSYDLANYRDIAYELGVKDFINKSIDIEELVTRLKKAVRDKTINKSALVGDSLTKREIEVLKEILKGENKKETAKKLFISERTLYNHIANIYSKLGVKNAIEAYTKALEIGYIDPVV